ncbi:unnamed protein product [Ectocarpus sp. CCAP 1310/34]|nr:unnamed protein product [Ectocarpus sp. CCAP 1310/34]
MGRMQHIALTESWKRIDDFRRIVARAESHKTFAVWKQFLLHDYPAYIAFRTALRTGNFRLRLVGLRRITSIFITGKDKYQFLVVDNLTEVSRYSRNDMSVVSKRFSISLGSHTFARIGLDERQEVSNRLYKTLTKRILSSTIEKLAPIAQLREVAIFDSNRISSRNHARRGTFADCWR